MRAKHKNASDDFCNVNISEMMRAKHKNASDDFCNVNMSEMMRAKHKNASDDFCRFWYLSWKGNIAKIVLYDRNIQFSKYVIVSINNLRDIDINNEEQEFHTTTLHNTTG